MITDRDLLVSIVIPLFNESSALQLFYDDLVKVIHARPEEFEILLVNDGSTDSTGDVAHEILAQDPRVVHLELSRNFGHQAALTAGMDAAGGDVVIMMDGDGEHPPGLIPEMLALFNAGYDMVLTQRAYASGVTWFKQWTSSAFYWLINRLGEIHLLPGGADFRLLSREVVEALQEMPEHHRFLRGMVSWIGFRVAILPFVPQTRLSGKSKYTLRKMLRLAFEGIFSFSLIPIQLGMLGGLLVICMALLEITYVLSFWLQGRHELLAPGWSSLMFINLAVGGTIMLLLGIIGIYVGFILREVKQRPTYIVRSRENKRERTRQSSEGPPQTRGE